MSYSFYKIIHILSIVIFFSMFAFTIAKTKGAKVEKILQGVFSLFILVSGMGLIARLGFGHAEPWPLWLKVKLTIWGVVTVGAPIILKRFPRFALGFFWFAIILLGLASYMANYKVS